MEELLCSIHNYTKFSKGQTSLYQIAQASLDCGINILFTTDRNIYIKGHDQYYYRSGQKVLMICGEELVDPLDNSSIRCLSLGIENEQFNLNVKNPGNEIRIITSTPSENTAERFIEVLNSEDILNHGLSASQKKIRDKILAFDRLLNQDIHCSILAGTRSSDLYNKALPRQFTQQELLSTAINHILLADPQTGDIIQDKPAVYRSLKAGHVFIAIDGLGDARGFCFNAEGNNEDEKAYPGDTIYLKNSITLKINVPEACICRLIRNGKLVKEWHHCRQVPYTIYEPGCYRVECALARRHDVYDWIFSNPIYALKG